MNEPAGTRHTQTTAFQGRIFTVTKDRVTLPNGRTVTFEIVRHPGSVVLLPLVDNSRIVLIRQYRYALDRWIWELPAGSLEPGEDPAAAAARECEEEIGLVPTTVEFAGSWYPTPGFCTEAMNYYRLTGLHAPNPDGPVAEKDEDEDIRVQEFSLDDARELVRRGDVVDLKTAWGLTLV
ncbi:MAG: NUDIX hydrolase [Acidobacteria bacterium]|nr:NUDIX hydrolase [Acidobacteriota bacterium]